MEKSVKKIFLNSFIVALAFYFSGCASVSIPNYIPDKYPYKKTIYGDYGKIVYATEEVIKEFGWEITNRADPSVFERSSVNDSAVNQILIFTKMRDTSLVVGSRYARLNAYVRSSDNNSCEVEFRYVTVSSMSVKNFYNYRKDHLIERMFKRIEELTK